MKKRAIIIGSVLGALVALLLLAPQEGEKEAHTPEAANRTDTGVLAPAGPAEPEITKPQEEALSEAVFLEAYRQVYCAEKEGAPEQIGRVLNRLGKNEQEWNGIMTQKREAARKDPEGMGRAWATIASRPCP